jgi:hypothetical protein
MKLKSLFISSFNLLLITFLIALLLISDFLFPILYKNDYMGNHLLKKEMIIKTDEKKLILIGGSSLAFSMESAILKSNFSDYQIINYGTHAGLGLDYLMEGLNDEVNPEDIVIFALEFEYYYRLESNRLLELHTRNLSGDNVRFQFLNRYIYRTNKLYDGIFRFYSNPNSVYRNHAINQFGDVITHHGLDSAILASPNKLEESFNEDFIYDLSLIIGTLESKGINVYMSFPPITNEYYFLNKEKIELLNYELIRNKLPIISNPSDFVFDEKYFYDTHYHMTKEGAILRTVQLIEDIRHNVA